MSKAKSFPWIVIYCGANANVEQVRRDWRAHLMSIFCEAPPSSLKGGRGGWAGVRRIL